MKEVFFDLAGVVSDEIKKTKSVAADKVERTTGKVVVGGRIDGGG